jgi:hypothetical protein
LKGRVRRGEKVEVIGGSADEERNEGWDGNGVEVKAKAYLYVLHIH